MLALASTMTGHWITSGVPIPKIDIKQSEFETVFEFYTVTPRTMQRCSLGHLGPEDVVILLGVRLARDPVNAGQNNVDSEERPAGLFSVQCVHSHQQNLANYPNDLLCKKPVHLLFLCKNTCQHLQV